MTAPAKINSSIQDKKTKQNVKSDKHTVKEIKNNPQSTHTDVTEIRRYASLLNIVAGMNSSDYKREPYIQKKKKIRHKDDSVKLSYNFDHRDVHDSFITLQNEPAIPKRKISCYDKNHNILRTHTTDEPSYTNTSSHVVPDSPTIKDVSSNV